jgi:hypothetical protein
VIFAGYFVQSDVLEDIANSVALSDRRTGPTYNYPSFFDSGYDSIVGA